MVLQLLFLKVAEFLSQLIDLLLDHLESVGFWRNDAWLGFIARPGAGFGDLCLQIAALQDGFRRLVH